MSRFEEVRGHVDAMRHAVLQHCCWIDARQQYDEGRGKRPRSQRLK